MRITIDVLLPSLICLVLIFGLVQSARSWVVAKRDGMWADAENSKFIFSILASMFVIFSIAFGLSVAM